MRLMMQVLIPVEKGNNAVADGTMATAMKKFSDLAKPEAAYFFVSEGKRAAIFIFEERDQAKLVQYNEPLFAALNADIRITPVLVADELEENL
ncbi:hypothetical protein [Microbulbifer mangrovi]|uniref:hypothetical protein n=1 Tax=Microbulbifer mangrovi TaxID=927787 RepID=UPI0009908B3E|nr:hypothetical protein [Microbulbifer mangrovi]